MTPLPPPLKLFRKFVSLGTGRVWGGYFAGISLELFQFEFLVISIRWSRVGQVRLLTTDRDQRWAPITADNCDPASDKCRL